MQRPFLSRTIRKKAMITPRKLHGIHPLQIQKNIEFTISYT